MSFAGWPFLGFFTLLTLLWFIWPWRQHRSMLLLIGSYAFYMYGGWQNIGLLLFVSLVSWGTGEAMNRWPDANKKILFLGILATLSPLVFYKLMLPVRGTTPSGETTFFIDAFYLPLGLSFFTFQAISYIVDRYRGTLHSHVKLKDYLLYIAFFPQLITGPIVRAHALIPQLTRKLEITSKNALIGGQIILYGLFQKLVLADYLNIYISGIWENPTMYNSLTLYFALSCFGLQIFLDFSGYSLIAIGLGRIFGIILPENFNEPLMAGNVTHFWQRWHITLTHWMRDYVFFPLGGGRGRSWQAASALLATMLIVGLWHGFYWTFLLWGFVQGLAMILHRVWRIGVFFRLPKRLVKSYTYRFVCWTITMNFMAFSGILFRAPDLKSLHLFWAALWGENAGFYWIYPPVFIVFFIIFVFYLPLRLFLGNNNFIPPFKNPTKSFSYSLLLILFLAIILFNAPEKTPFIYLQF